MSHCCQKGNAKGPLNRYLQSGSWLIPGAILLTLPKCPFCFAAYFTLFTGMGLSLTAASVCRTGLLASCLALLSVLAARQLIMYLHGSQRRTN